MAPATIGEGGVIPVSGDPVSTGLESQGGHIRVCKHVDLEEDRTRSVHEIEEGAIVEVDAVREA